MALASRNDKFRGTLIVSGKREKGFCKKGGVFFLNQTGWENFEK